MFHKSPVRFLAYRVAFALSRHHWHLIVKHTQIKLLYIICIGFHIHARAGGYSNCVARLWWSRRAGENAETMTWEDFQEAFQADVSFHYYSSFWYANDASRQRLWVFSRGRVSGPRGVESHRGTVKIPLTASKRALRWCSSHEVVFLSRLPEPDPLDA